PSHVVCCASSERRRVHLDLHSFPTRRSSDLAEITVVFDGADVTSIPAAGARNVRVLFSDPGVLADDVIRSLVLAEPQGRPLVVATSDQAVVNSVCAAGSYAIPAAVLLARLGRV